MTPQKGRTGMMSFWIFAGRMLGIGEFEVRSGSASRRYALMCCQLKGRWKTKGAI
jgi:hypothetical protein